MRPLLTPIIALARTKPGRFGVRLLVSAFVLGIAYTAVVGLYQYRRHAVTPTQKLALFRSSLDQTLLAGGRLAQFSDTNSVASTTLSQQFASFETTITALQNQLADTPADQLTIGQRRTAQAIIDRHSRAISSYKTAYQALAQPMSYDPYTDLGNLNLTKDAAKLSARAKAAQKGLASNVKGTVTDSGDGLVAQSGQAQTSIATASTQTLLTDSANCFGSLADKVSAKDASAGQIRQSCLQAYPALRAQIIDNILELSFSEQYLKESQSASLPLLKQLDAKIAQKQ